MQPAWIPKEHLVHTTRKAGPHRFQLYVVKVGAIWNGALLESWCVVFTIQRHLILRIYLWGLHLLETSHQSMVYKWDDQCDKTWKWEMACVKTQTKKMNNYKWVLKYYQQYPAHLKSFGFLSGIQEWTNFVSYAKDCPVQDKWKTLLILRLNWYVSLTCCILMYSFPTENFSLTETYQDRIICSLNKNM